MRISEIITEALSLENTMSAVAADIGNNITTMFDALRDSADNWLGSHDNLDGWSFIAAGVETRMWWDRIWAPRTNPKKGSGKVDTGLQGELYDLSRQAGRTGQPLAELLRDMITNRGNFLKLSQTLPPMLIAIGSAHGNENLVTRAKQWQDELREFMGWMAELRPAKPTKTSKGSRSEPIPEPKMPPTSRLPSAIPGQNVAADRIVNDVLRNLPSGIAGDIRQIIAKSPNKIKALQAELIKRGIKM